MKLYGIYFDSNKLGKYKKIIFIKKFVRKTKHPKTFFNGKNFIEKKN